MSLFIGFAAVLLLNFLITHIYLQYGAALSSMIGHLLIVISGYYFSSRYYKIPFSYAKDLVVYLFFFALSLLVVMYDFSGHVYMNMLYQALVLLVIVIIFLATIFPADLARFTGSFRDLRNRLLNRQ